MTEEDWLTSPSPGDMFDWLTAAEEYHPGDVTVKERRCAFRDRKLRLFSVACCHMVGRRLRDRRSRQAVEIAEKFADKVSNETDLQSARHHADAVWRERPYNDKLEKSDELAAMLAAECCRPDAWGGAHFMTQPPYLPDKEVIADLLREVVGNPFRQLEVRSKCGRCGGRGQYKVMVYEGKGRHSHVMRHCEDCLGEGGRWPAWRTSLIAGLAMAAYAERPGGKCEDHKTTFYFCGHCLDPHRLSVLADALLDAGCPEETYAPLLDHLRSKGPHFRGCWALDLVLRKE